MNKKNTLRNTATLPTARSAALKLLGLVLRGHLTVDSQFSSVIAGLESRDVAFVKHLVSTTLRHLIFIDKLLDRYIKRTPPAKVEDVLRLGVAQILFLDTAPHAAVDTSVRLLKKFRRSAYTGLVNAVLRKVVVYKNVEKGDSDEKIITTPEWLYKGWVGSYGKDIAMEISASHLQEAPVDITVKHVSTSAGWAKKLSATVLPSGSLRIEKAGKVPDLSGFKSGEWWVQDAAAALPAKILMQHITGFGNDCTVLDLCSAPGGKTMQLSALGVSVVALDKSPSRLMRLKENLERTSLSASLVEADIFEWSPVNCFNAILLDAPCSATGTIRRHPDLPYLKTRNDIKQSAKLQLAMIEQAIDFLIPGGILIYSVCSLESEEGPSIRLKILEGTNLVPATIDTNALGVPSSWLDDTGALRTLPFYWAEFGGLDGFYIAAFKKPHD